MSYLLIDELSFLLQPFFLQSLKVIQHLYLLQLNSSLIEFREPLLFGEQILTLKLPDLLLKHPRQIIQLFQCRNKH